MIRLMYNYYEDKNIHRKREIDFCLQKNLDNKLLTTVIIETPNKPTYNYFFDRINRITGPNDINIICNSDIFFDETIGLVSSYLSNKQVFALSRWNWMNQHNIAFYDRADSQDTWIIKGPIENVYGNFTLGIPGCDNRIAYEFHKAKYAVTNPSKSIKSYHVHNSGIRNYTSNEVIPEPYLTVVPVSL